MKVICERAALVEALNLAGAVVVSRTPRPVLRCVKLTASEGRMHLAATDLEIALHLTDDQVQVEADGQVVVVADKLSAIVRESVEPTLTLQSEEASLHIRGADSHFTIYGQSAEDFPAVEIFSGDGDFQVSAAALTELTARTMFATARETSRYAINGVLLEREGRKLTMVATDGRRLALARGACAPADTEGAEKTEGHIIPTKALNLLQRLLNDPEEMVTVKVTESQAHFVTDRATLSTNLVEGNFPPYRDVIPREHDKRAVFATHALSSGVRRAALLTNEESKGVRFSFAPEQLTLTSRAPDMGEAEISVPIESFEGEPFDIGFNPFFVIDALKVADGEQVTVECKAPNKPGTLRVGQDFLYVIMPVSL